MRNRLTIVATTALAVVSLSSPAIADPITIVAGTINVSGFARGDFRSVSFSLAGPDDFSVSGTESDGPGSSVPRCSQFAPCATGGTTSPTLSMFVGSAIGSATLNGTHYEFVQSIGSFQFTGDSVTVPGSSAPTLALTSPFTFTGNLNIFGFDQSNQRLDLDLGRVSLAGQGVATTRLSRVGDRYAVSGFTYEFAGVNASATPEPASLLLLGTGAAMVIGRKRRRDRAGS